MAGAWYGVSVIFVRLLTMFRLAVLAHLLLPDVFGLTALVVLIVGALWVLSDFGITQAVIQRKELDDVYTHTAWNLNWIRGLLLALACYLSSSLIADFFDQPELEHLIQIAALIPLLRGFESLGMVLLKRDLNFRSQTYVNLVREMVNTIVAVSLVLYWSPTAESIVWGLVAGNLMAVFVSYLVHAYRPSLQVDKASVLDIWSFGGHLLGAGVLVFAMTNLDNVVIGKMVGMEQLGFYTVAFTLAGVLTTQLVQLMNQILFPAMSRIREDAERIRRVLERSLRAVAGILTPVVCFIALFPESIVRVLFSEKWYPAIPVLMVLLVMGWVRGIASVFGPVLLVYGRVAALHGMKWKEFVLFGVSIVPAVHYLGIVGAAYVLLAVYLLSLFLHVRIVLQEQPRSLSTIIKHTFLGALPALISSLLIMPILLFADITNFLLGALFILVWAVMLYVRERQFVLQFWEMRKRGEGAELSGDSI